MTARPLTRRELRALQSETSASPVSAEAVSSVEATGSAILDESPVDADAPAAPESAPVSDVAAPRGRKPAKARRSAKAPGTKPRRSTWTKIKALSATGAIAALVAAAALPSVIAPALAQSKEGDQSASAEADAQSFTTDSTIKAEVLPREGYAATTEKEIKDAHAQRIAAALASGLPATAIGDLEPADKVLMPMKDGSYTLTDGFGASRPGRTHLGQDFAAPVGAPIRAAMNGCVSMSSESFSGYGVTIRIESVLDGKAVSTLYSHMNYGTRAVEVGDCVKAGDYIGDVGSTGYVQGSCLHFEARPNGSPVDPLNWLKQNVR